MSKYFSRYFFTTVGIVTNYVPRAGKRNRLGLWQNDKRIKLLAQFALRRHNNVEEPYMTGHVTQKEGDRMLGIDKHQEPP